MGCLLKRAWSGGKGVFAHGQICVTQLKLQMMHHFEMCFALRRHEGGIMGAPT